jgi:aldehyde:ferredoxin oxidoreductase
MVGGYTGKILEVDLTNSKVGTLPLDYGDASKFLGGRGLMNKLLWDRLTPMTQGFDSLTVMFFWVHWLGSTQRNRPDWFKSLTITSTDLT